MKVDWQPPVMPPEASPLKLNSRVGGGAGGAGGFGDGGTTGGVWRLTSRRIGRDEVENWI